MAVSEVAIVGAGPYGLSIATHLRARGTDFRILGKPMQSWRERMPAGMLLKSEGFASNLYDPHGRFTLEQFCVQNGMRFRAWGVPVPLDTFVAYALSFQRQIVPEVEERTIVALEEAPNGFRLRLDDGQAVVARNVILAVGITYFAHVPDVLAHVPSEFVSHSSEHHNLASFKGRDVTVIGAGASAFDTAALLHAAGASVRVIARRTSIDWTGAPLPEHRSLWHRIRYPNSGMSPGLRSRLYEDAPMLFRLLPAHTRIEIVRTFLGPAPPWWLKDLVVGQIPLMLGLVPERAEIRAGRVCVQLRGRKRCEVLTDHVIAATGFRVDPRRLSFLNEKIQSQLKLVGGSPALSSNFESSVGGLYFVGLSAAHTFGPLMRFMLGAGYTSRRLSAHLARKTKGCIVHAAQ